MGGDEKKRNGEKIGYHRALGNGFNGSSHNFMNNEMYFQLLTGHNDRKTNTIIKENEWQNGIKHNANNNKPHFDY